MCYKNLKKGKIDGGSGTRRESHHQGNETKKNGQDLSTKREEHCSLGNTARLKVQDKQVMLKEPCQCWAGSPRRSLGEMWSSSGESGERPEIALDLTGKEGVGKMPWTLILQGAVSIPLVQPR